MKCSVGERGQTRRSEGTNRAQLTGGASRAVGLVGSVTCAIIRIGKSRAAEGPFAMLKSVLAGCANLVQANSQKGATLRLRNSHDSSSLQSDDPRARNKKVTPVAYRCKEPRVNQSCAGVMLSLLVSNRYLSAA
jgi:hypothetical protein